MIKKNKFSILLGLLILFLSLTGPGTFEKVDFFEMTFLDKIAHAIMYFGFMSVIIYENRKQMEIGRTLFLASLIPFFYGIGMELLQSFVTANRTASFFDIVFNTVGILASVILWSILKPQIKRVLK